MRSENKVEEVDSNKIVVATSKEVTCCNCDEECHVVPVDDPEQPNLWTIPDTVDSDGDPTEEYYLNCEICGDFYCCDCSLLQHDRSSGYHYQLLEACGCCGHQCCAKCRDEIADCLKCAPLKICSYSSQEVDNDEVKAEAEKEDRKEEEEDREVEEDNHVIRGDIWLGANANQGLLTLYGENHWFYLIREAMKYAPSREMYKQTEALYISQWQAKANVIFSHTVRK